MKNMKHKIVIAAFILMAGTFLFSAFGATRAALITSGIYDSKFEMYDIGVTLNENEEPRAWRSYDSASRDWYVNGETSLFSTLDTIRYGVTYPERLSVRNSGQIDEYVRVTIYKYWIDRNGKKAPAMDPDLIDLNLLTGDNGWIIDENYSTKERTVLYYTKPLKGSKALKGGELSSDFADAMTLDKDIKNYVKQETTAYDETSGYTIITTEYIYDGCQFCIDVEVDAIQTHNAEDAALSAWGRAIEIADDGTLSLGKEGQ